MEAKHTPGPWHVEYKKDFGIEGNSFIVLNDERYPSAFVPAWDDPMAGEGYAADEAKANAKLIAAAPKLLEQLCLAHDYLAANGWDDDPRIEPIRAAIASAT